MHTANRSPTTRYPPALRTRTAQLTPSCARHLAGSGVDGFFARCVPHRCSSRAPCSGGAEAARGVVAGSFGVCECHVAHPRVAPCCRLPSCVMVARRRFVDADMAPAHDAPAARHAWGGRGPLRWSLHLCFGGACGMWLGLSRAKNPAVRMAVWPCHVARGRHQALDSLNLPLY